MDIYKPQPLLRVMMEQENGKLRSLAIPTVRDRVAQTAVAITLTPLFEAEFEECSYAYRRGRSVQQTVGRIERLREEGFRWVVDADITAFFDNIDHALLLGRLRALVKDARLCQLIEAWVKAAIFQDGAYLSPERGVPQGSPLSPMLANLYLDDLDEVLLDHDMRLVRYADDFLVLCRSEARAEQVMELTRQTLTALHLEFNASKTRIVDFDRGFRFLGYQFIKNLAFPADAPPKPDLSKQQSEPEEPGEPPTALSQAFRQAYHERDLVDPAAGNTSAMAGSWADPALRTLYLMEPGCVLAKESERLVVRRKGEVIHEAPALHVDQVLVFGPSQITTQCMAFCLEQSIPIVLLSGKGRYYGVVDAFDTDPVLLHREQFLRSADSEFCLGLSKRFVQGKIANMRLVLRRYARKRDAIGLTQAEHELAKYESEAERADTLDQLRGYEGIAGKAYFEAWRSILGPEWRFDKRVRQPPTDPINAVLSFGYTLLFYNVYSFIRARGLNVHVGFLHPLRAGHPALASDMMEEFRPLVVDALVFNLVLNGRLTPDDFIAPAADGEACLLREHASKQFIHAFEDKINSAVTHTPSGRQLDYRRCIDLQVQTLSALLRGSVSEYLPMVQR